MGENTVLKSKIATDMPEDKKIDIIEILSVMWKHKLIIIACALVVSVIMAVKVQYFTDYTYTANGIIYVSNKTDAVKSTDEISKSDIDTSRTVSETYRQVFTTRSFLKDVSNRIDNKYSWKAIKGMVSISSMNETEFLNVSVTAANPGDAYEIANAVIEEAPTKFLSIFKGGEIEVADAPEFPDGPNSKQGSRKVMIGFLIGLLIGAAICFAIYYFDTSIHRGEDITQKYGISILGELAQ